MQDTHSILVTEEDPATRGFLVDQLTDDGYQVLAADSKSAALAVLETKCPDLVICDLNGQTLGLLDAVRNANRIARPIDTDTPLIVLSEDRSEVTRVRFFDRGSDDVVSKPFSYAELRGRIHAILRRTYGKGVRRQLRVGAMSIDTFSRHVTVAGQVVALTQTEFALLQHLAVEPTRVFTKHELLRDVWGFQDRCRTRTLDSHAYRLRAKLRRAGGGEYLRAIWGVGFQLVQPPA